MCRATPDEKLDTPFANLQISYEADIVPASTRSGTGFFMPRTLSAPPQGQLCKELPCRNGHRRYRPIGRSFSSRKMEMARGQCTQEPLQSPANPASARYSNSVHTTTTVSQAASQPLSISSQLTNSSIGDGSTTADNSLESCSTTSNAAFASLAVSCSLLNKPSASASGAEISSSQLAEWNNTLHPCVGPCVKPTVTSRDSDDLSTAAAGTVTSPRGSNSCSLLFNSCNSLFGDDSTCPFDAAWGSAGCMLESIDWAECNAATATTAARGGSAPALVPSCVPSMPDVVLSNAGLNSNQACNLAQRQLQLNLAAFAGGTAIVAGIPLDFTDSSCFVPPGLQMCPTGDSNTAAAYGFCPASTASIPPTHAAAGQTYMHGAPGDGGLALERRLLLDEESDLAILDKAITNELSQLLQLRQQLVAAASARVEAAGLLPNKAAHHAQAMTGPMPAAAAPAAATLPATAPSAVASTPAALPARMAFAAQAALRAAGCDDTAARFVLPAAVVPDIASQPAAVSSMQHSMLGVFSAAPAVQIGRLPALSSSGCTSLGVPHQQLFATQQ